MIVYLFNHYFPDNSGFGRRCLREIHALSSIDEVTVICRKNVNDEEVEKLNSEHKPITVLRYSAKSEIVHRPENYKSNGLYEIKRNLDINLAQAKLLIKTFNKNKNQNVELYCVTSPLTVPLIAYFISKVFGVKPKAVAFHDLEPELAMHLKNLSSNNWLVRLEFFLESLVSHQYEKIVVTSDGQAEQLVKRTHIDPKKVIAIPNSTDIVSNRKTSSVRSTKIPNEFKIVYLSTMSFGYTVDGFIDFLKAFHNRRNDLKNFNVTLIGSGEGLFLIEKFVKENHLKDQVIIKGHVKDPLEELKHANVGIIPWKQDIMTSTMLPTKLFEYLSLGLPVIAPDFGEFKRILSHKKNALLFSNSEECVNFVKLLAENNNLRRDLSENGKKLYEDFYQTNILNEKFLKFYLE